MSSTPESERGRWTPATGDVLERLRHRKETRLRFLHALYEAAEGSTSNGVRFKELGEQLGLTEEETWIVRSYLANEGLLSGATIVYIVITHQGVKESRGGTPRSRSFHRTLSARGKRHSDRHRRRRCHPAGQHRFAPRSRAPRRYPGGSAPAGGRPRSPHRRDRSTRHGAGGVARRGGRPRLAAVRETVGTLRDLLEAAVSSGKAAAGILAALGAARGLLALLG